MNSVTVLGKIKTLISISFLNPVTLKSTASQSCHAQVYGVSILSRFM